MNIKELAKQCGFTDHSNGDLYLAESKSLNEALNQFAQAIALQAVAQFISEQKPVAWRYKQAFIEDEITRTITEHYNHVNSPHDWSHLSYPLNYPTLNDYEPLYQLGGQP